MTMVYSSICNEYITVHRLLSRKVFLACIAKILRHTGQNAIIEGDLECILTRLL